MFDITFYDLQAQSTPLQRALSDLTPVSQALHSKGVPEIRLDYLLLRRFSTVLSSAVDGIRLSLHVLAATIWVGGQIVLAGLVPSLRKVSPEATRVAANAFAKLSWPAFAVLVLTGFWNLGVVNMSSQTTAWKVVLGIKIAVVVISGASAYLHTKAKSTAGLAVWGSIAGLSAVAALVMGVFLAN